jgi:hypothetical protein
LLGDGYMYNEDNYDINNICDKFDNDIFDEENENELKVNAQKFQDAVVWGTDWTTETIASQLKKKNIDLNPAFQRRDAWTDEEKSRFIESLMLGIPVPPIILAEIKGKKNLYIVIDGKQRLLSLRRFYSEGTENDSFKQLKLKGLQILSELNGKIYREIDEFPYKTNLDNQTIRTIVIKNWPDEAFLYTVFLRLNTGSKKLSPQELRQALHPGEFLNFLDEVTSESAVMKAMLNNKSEDSRMRDVELALRYFAYKYCIREYNGNLKEFLDITCEKLNNEWDSKSEEIRKEYKELENAINLINKIFGEKKAFSRFVDGSYTNRFHRSLFEILTYYLSIAKLRDLIQEDLFEVFKAKFEEMNQDSEFLHSISDTTKEISRVCTRYNKMFELLASLETVKDSQLKLPKLEQDEKGISIKFVTI